MKAFQKAKHIAISMLLGACVLALLSCSSIPQSVLDWETTQTEDSISAYEAYIENYPDSSFTKTARERLSLLCLERHWQIASTADSFSVYIEFLRKHPQSPYTEEAYAKLQILFSEEWEKRVNSSWERARESDQLDSYEQFLINNPSSPFISGARKRLGEIEEDPALEKILQIKIKELDKFKKTDQTPRHYLLLFPVISDDEELRLVYKDHEYMHHEITKRPGGFFTRPLPSDYELIRLRSSEPYESGVLFVGRHFTSRQESLRESLWSLLVEFRRSISKELGIASRDLEVFAVLPTELSDSSNFFEDLISIAQTDSDFDRSLDVERSEYLAEIMPAAGDLVVRSFMAAATAQDPDARRRAELMLIKIGDLAVPFLIGELSSPPQRKRRQLIGDMVAERARKNERRSMAINVLKQIGDQRAIPPLVDMLMEWDIGAKAASALRSLEWSPASPAESVYMSVASKNRPALVVEWMQTREILLAEVSSPKREVVKSAVYAFIAIGKEEIIPELINTLNTKGSKIMAETFLNSGNHELSDAAKVWAYKNGYRLSAGSGAHEVRWGRF